MASDDPHSKSYAVASLTAGEMARMLERGEVTSVEVTEQLIGRIEAIDRSGPRLRSVLEVAPDALEAAHALDREREQGRARGPLHGIPVLVKDNIDTAAPLHTTGGSLCLAGSSPSHDAPVVEALRAAGAVVLGKTNLSEWANFRGAPSSSGWSAVGGQTLNPHVLDRTPGGSSSGSASAVAARLVPLAVGTETDGSILCPSSACGIAGLKPTVGLVSRTGIVPISHSQDTAGPMGRSVEDVAMLLEALARAVDDGRDALAVSSRRPARHEGRYLSLLGDGNLAGTRVGVLREGGYFGYHGPTDKVFETCLSALRSAGATVLDPLPPPERPLLSNEDEMIVLTHEFRSNAEAYFAARSSAGEQGLPRTLADVIVHLEATPGERRDLFGAELLELSAGTAGTDAPEYKEALERNQQRARQGLDALFEQVDVVAVPAMPPAWVIDHVIGDEYLGAGWSPAAVAGYPSAALPIGDIGGLPVAAALWAPQWSEATVLRVMFALERELGRAVTSPEPAFAQSVSLRA